MAFLKNHPGGCSFFPKWRWQLVSITLGKKTGHLVSSNIAGLSERWQDAVNVKC
jgi:hypothetical protein